MRLAETLFPPQKAGNFGFPAWSWRPKSGYPCCRVRGTGLGFLRRLPRHEAIGNHHGLFRPGPQTAEAGRCGKKKQCQQSYPVPTYRRTTPRFPESLYANKHAQAQPSGERLGQASWPFAVDAADEGRTKLFLTADSAPRWMRDRKGIGRVVFRQPPVFDWMSGNFSVTPGF